MLKKKHKRHFKKKKGFQIQPFPFSFKKGCVSVFSSPGDFWKMIQKNRPNFGRTRVDDPKSWPASPCHRQKPWDKPPLQKAQQMLGIIKQTMNHQYPPHIQHKSLNHFCCPFTICLLYFYTEHLIFTHRILAPRHAIKLLELGTSSASGRWFSIQLGSNLRGEKKISQKKNSKSECLLNFPNLKETSWHHLLVTSNAQIKSWLKLDSTWQYLSTSNIKIPPHGHQGSYPMASYIQPAGDPKRSLGDLWRYFFRMSTPPITPLAQQLHSLKSLPNPKQLESMRVHPPRS